MPAFAMLVRLVKGGVTVSHHVPGPLHVASCRKSGPNLFHLQLSISREFCHDIARLRIMAVQADAHSTCANSLRQRARHVTRKIRVSRCSVHAKNMPPYEHPCNECLQCLILFMDATASPARLSNRNTHTFLKDSKPIDRCLTMTPQPSPPHPSYSICLNDLFNVRSI